ncbi:HNH endonuclease [Myxococcaceae bacterium JPH2]|nr:HNH endonuclease [Myxococcaceae bacterium JPH2]
MRKVGSKRTGAAFSPLEVQAVWNKAQIVVGADPNRVRKDACGAWIHLDQYGNTDSDAGWEIDHIRPVAHNGTDDLSNLQPLQWQNNRHKSDNIQWACAVTAIAR